MHCWSTAAGVSGDLPQIIGLTSLPLTIFNTHGHRDHTSGDYLFDDRIHINEGDVPLLKKSYDPAQRTATLRPFRKRPGLPASGKMPGFTRRCPATMHSVARSASIWADGLST